MMKDNVESSCDQHEHRYDCPDCLIDRHNDGSFGIIIHDGGDSHIGIKFCPWCGARLDGKERTVAVVLGYYDNTIHDEGDHTWVVAVFTREPEAETFRKAVEADTEAFIRGEVKQADMMDWEFSPNWTDPNRMGYGIEEVPFDPEWKKEDDGEQG